MLTMNYQYLQEKYSKKKKKKKHNKISKNTKEIKDKEKLTYQQQLEDERWKKKRLKVLKRDGFNCIICHSNKNLNVHHLVYKEGKMAWEYPNELLITLCEDCHKKVHNTPSHKYYPIIK